MENNQQPSVPNPPAETQQTSSVPDEPVPNVWPGAFGLYAYSRRAVLYNLGTLLGLFGLSILVSIIANLVSGDRSVSYNYGVTSTNASFFGSLIELVSELIGIWISVATALVLIGSVKRQKMAIDDGLRTGWSVFLPFLGLSILTGLIAIGSILLFIVPAFFIIPRLVLAQYYLLEDKLGVTASIRASWEATRGNVGKVWGMFGFTLLLVLLAFTLIGIPFAIYFGIMYQAATVLLYFYLKKQPALAPAAPVAPSAPTTPSGPVPPAI